MFTLGVAGDVGAGKSSVCRFFERNGATVIDADAIVHELWERKPLLDAARSRWGERIAAPDGAVDRREVARILFASEGEYAWLCGILHPMVRREIEARLSKLDGLVLVEVPLLFESPLPWWADGTIYVSASREARGRRNAFRGLDEAEIQRRESFLLPRKEKMERADLVIENDGALDHLETTVRDLTDTLLSLAGIVSGESVFGSEERAGSFETVLQTERIATALSRKRFSDGRAGVSFVTEERSLRRIEEIAQGLDTRCLWANSFRRCSYASRKRIMEDLRA